VFKYFIVILSANVNYRMTNMKKRTGWLSLLALSISLVCHQAAASSRLTASAIRVMDAQGNNVSQPLLDSNPVTQWQSKLDYNRWLEMDL